MLDKTFTKILNKAHRNGLQLDGRASLKEYDIARAVARAIRIYGPKDGIIYIDHYDALILYRVGDIAYKYDVQLAISQPGGGFPGFRVDLARLHRALTN